VVWVDDEAMRALNRRWRGRDRTTDVLSFSMREGRGADLADGVLGDVVVSLETALRTARRRRTSPDRVVAHLLVHGVLHLLGHDHLGSARRRARMRAEERRILRRLAGVAPVLRVRPAVRSPSAAAPPSRARAS
jgi:probable rRNA maturation factor